MNIVFYLHSYNRWLIIAVALLILIRSTFILAGRLSVGRIDSTALVGLRSVLGIQGLLGLVYLIWSGVAGAGVPWYRIAHLVVMLIVVVIGDLSSRWKDAEPKIFARNNILLIIGLFVLIGIGVAFLPGGASRWTFRIP